MTPQDFARKWCRIADETRGHPFVDDLMAVVKWEVDPLLEEIKRLEKITKLQAAALDVWKSGKATKPA